MKRIVLVLGLVIAIGCLSQVGLTQTPDNNCEGDLVSSNASGWTRDGAYENAKEAACDFCHEQQKGCGPVVQSSTSCGIWCEAWVVMRCCNP